ncbi:MAG: HEAT repeat domain-containing protein [Gemmataceae bacterium]
MTTSEWREFLQQWSDEWLATEEIFPAQVRKRRWLGFPPATEKQLLQLEKRLGYELPPSYRNFLLTTNGWLRTSMFIDRIRSVPKVDWLESDAPELLDNLSPKDDGDLMQNYPSEDYFSYDGRPIFEEEHLRKALIIADPIPGDSMIYLLNPLIVAPDGEWEAWRFAHWIPGAERFPSFELLMRAEHELFLHSGHSQKFFGPYQGDYAPDQPRHAARAIGRGRAKPPRLTVPQLIAQLESPTRATRANAAKRLLREFRPHDPKDEHPEIIEPLSRVLRSDLERDVRSAAAAMLGSYGDTGAIGPLIKALDDTELTSIALGALFYLAICVKDSGIADAMIRFLEPPRGLFDTQHAVQILEELKDTRVAAIGLRLLDHAPFILPDVEGITDRTQAEAFHRSSVRFLGAFAFARFAIDATEELVKRLTHADAGVRAASTAALRECPNRGPHLAPFLTPLLEDLDPGVRQQATMTLQFLEPSPPFRYFA